MIPWPPRNTASIAEKQMTETTLFAAYMHLIRNGEANCRHIFGKPKMALKTTHTCWAYYCLMVYTLGWPIHMLISANTPVVIMS
jgi:hypothetical protein